jgi:hypothetical protein
MGFTSTLGHLFVRRVPTVYFVENQWKILNELLFVLNCTHISLDCTSDYESDGSEDSMPELTLNIHLLYGLRADLSQQFYKLFEDGLNEKLENLPPISKEDHPIMFCNQIEGNGEEDEENDDEYTYILCGGFGVCYPGSVYGGSRHNQPKEFFSFSMELPCLAEFPVYKCPVAFNCLKGELFCP